MGFKVKGLRRASLISFKEVGIIKGVYCNRRMFSNGKGES
jgi:hypothetical protein